ncbi:MAG: ribonuclease III [Egibacteraceae bacterium]
MSREPGLGALEDQLAVVFTDPSLLEQALTHRSFAFEEGGLPTYERLEFLGDAVLGLVVAHRVYRLLPDAPEGRLAKIRSSAVNTRALAGIARDLDLGSHVRLGHGEEQSGGRDKDSILADTIESLIGAVYLEGGMEAATSLVDRLFADLLDHLVAWQGSLDFKTSLQELTASELSALPVYRLAEEGPDHAKRFTAEVEIEGAVLGRGRGRSKKEAEQGAAEEAYVTLIERLAISSP